MGQYLKAENLKFKRTFTTKLILLIPLATLMLTWFLSFNWYQVNAFNWWYVLMMPGYIALISAFSDQKETKKLGYRGILVLPVSLKKIWIAKIMNLGLYLALSCLILLIGILLGSFTVPDPLPLGTVCLGMFLIFVTSLWQIPFCLFLSGKIGMVGTILIQAGAGFPLGVLLAIKPIWWLCPYSWTMRLMIPVLGILPNGTLAPSRDLLLNSSSIPVGITLSILLLTILLIATTGWFQKQEAR
jgi:ABC-2 type transport system permease protein